VGSGLELSVLWPMSAWRACGVRETDTQAARLTYSASFRMYGPICGLKDSAVISSIFRNNKASRNKPVGSSLELSVLWPMSAWRACGVRGTDTQAARLTYSASFRMYGPICGLKDSAVISSIFRNNKASRKKERAMKLSKVFLPVSNSTIRSISLAHFHSVSRQHL
jgi:hypothetical protein